VRAARKQKSRVSGAAVQWRRMTDAWTDSSRLVDVRDRKFENLDDLGADRLVVQAEAHASYAL